MTIDVVDVSQEQIEEALAQAKTALPGAAFEVLDNVVRAYSTVAPRRNNSRARAHRGHPALL